MKKLTTINPVIIVIVFLAIFFSVNFKAVNAQADKTCTGNGHDDKNIIQGRVTYLTGAMLTETAHVTHGIVKLLKVNPPSLDVIAVDSADINSSGYYVISGFPQGDYYLVAYPDDKDEDYVISFYPSGQLWNNAVKVVMGHNQVRTCNIRTVEMFQTPGGTPVQGETADSGNHNYKLKNSVIIAKSGNQYRGFAMTNNQGRYLINSIQPGNYTLTATRFGFSNLNHNISITSSPATINFYLGRDSSYTISVSNNTNIVKNFKLYQNYPNPFNPGTEIGFSLDKGMNVKLAVYSIDGKVVKELLNDYRAPGEYKFRFSGENLSSGIYNYILETGNGQKESKLMVLTK